VHHHYVTWPFPHDRHSTPNLLVRAKYKPRGKLSLFGDTAHHKKSRRPTLNNLSYIQSFLALHIQISALTKLGLSSQVCSQFPNWLRLPSEFYLSNTMEKICIRGTHYAGIREVPSSNLDPLSDKTGRISHLFVRFSSLM
jgi:hypothetical protein